MADPQNTYLLDGAVIACLPYTHRSKAHRLKAVLGADQGALKVLHHAGAKTDGIDVSWLNARACAHLAKGVLTAANRRALQIYG